ncbi:MAG: fumarate reductase subunit D [Gammaproteobacteria bacterium]|jgi:fumarate reductase subunit D
MTFRTAAFEAYIQPARAKPQLWRLILGIILVVAIFLGVTIGLFSLSALLGWIGMTEADGNLNTRASMTVGLLTFIGGIFGVWAAVKFLHGRPFHTLLGPGATLTGQRSGIRRNFIIAASVVFAFQAITMTASSLYFGTVPNQPLPTVTYIT